MFYAKLGLPGEALRQYRLYRETLRREYGLDPSPETGALLRSFAEEPERIRAALAVPLE